ncbi:MAG: MMPL family transporter [Saprospiraceae bacterium]|nr:MMPL family transporter [Saprospiraceae bacterium]
MQSYRNLLLACYALLAVASLLLLTRLKFTFDFEQFFPQGDADWEFFKNYIKDFESDDNFLLIAVERRDGVFERAFLEKFHDFTLKAGELPHVTSSTSLTKMQYPLKTPFGITAIPAIHIDDPSYYASDRERVLQDKRFVHNLISDDGTALAVVLKTVNQSTLPQAQELVGALNALLKKYDFDEAHLLGRAYFQTEMVRMEMREISVSTVIAALLASLVLFFIYRRWRMVLVAMAGVGLSLLFFLGLLSALGRELNALAALYPILMCIVGVADTIHLSSKYVDELEKGHDRETAIRTTMREVGLATFITSITTAIGFASLLTNRTAPIQGFGLNAALGVLAAFFIIYGWLWAILPRFGSEQLVRYTPEYAFWGRFMAWTHRFTREKSRSIAWVSLGLLAVCLLGISLINTNYRIKSNLPRGQKITTDFLYFEKKFSGFRPVEFAVFPQNGHKADDFEVLREMDKLESHLRTYSPVKTLASVNDLYRSIRAMNHGNRPEAYRLPDSLEEFRQIRRIAERVPASYSEVLLSKNRDKARIAGRMQDVGRDTVALMQASIEQWWQENTDSAVAKFKITGTGVILDKNSAYIRDNMLQGLIPSVLVVALIMALLFKNARMLLVFCVPNVFPLLFAGALIGYLGIPLEAGIATVFSIVFGIATDDTVHFLSSFKLNRSRGLSVEESLRVTLAETGKAMCFSSIILFFSFLVMLFSIHPPSVTVGLLVSATLAGALFCDLLLAPVMVRWLMRDE